MPPRRRPIEGIDPTNVPGSDFNAEHDAQAAKEHRARFERAEGGVGFTPAEELDRQAAAKRAKEEEKVKMAQDEARLKDLRTRLKEEGEEREKAAADEEAAWAKKIADAKVREQQLDRKIDDVIKAFSDRGEANEKKPVEAQDDAAIDAYTREIVQKSEARQREADAKKTPKPKKDDVSFYKQQVKSAKPAPISKRQARLATLKKETEQLEGLEIGEQANAEVAAEEAATKDQRATEAIEAGQAYREETADIEAEQRIAAESDAKAEKNRADLGKQLTKNATADIAAWEEASSRGDAQAEYQAAQQLMEAYAGRLEALSASGRKKVEQALESIREMKKSGIEALTTAVSDDLDEWEAANKSGDAKQALKIAETLASDYAPRMNELPRGYRARLETALGAIAQAKKIETDFFAKGTEIDKQSTFEETRLQKRQEKTRIDEEAAETRAKAKEAVGDEYIKRQKNISGVGAEDSANVEKKRDAETKEEALKTLEGTYKEIEEKLLDIGDLESRMKQKWFFKGRLRSEIAGIEGEIEALLGKTAQAERDAGLDVQLKYRRPLGESPRDRARNNLEATKNALKALGRLWPGPTDRG